MTGGPLIIILEMILLVIENVLGTMFSLLGLLGQLIGSLLLVSYAGGSLGIFLAFAVLALAGFFLAKFFFGSVKTVILLIIAGFFVLVFIVWGLSTV
jgi:hypothetical protein